MKITVKANASGTRVPDWMTIKFKLTALDEDKNNSAIKLNSVLDTVKAYLANIVDWSEVKTSSFSVKEKHNSKRVEKFSKRTNSYETTYDDIFLGYESAMSMSVGLPIDVKLVIKLIADLAAKDSVYINVDYSLKDFDSFQEEVMRNALDIASAKAEAIASKFGDKEVSCVDIDYTYIEHQTSSAFRSASLDMCYDSCASRYEDAINNIADNFNPEPISITEAVKTVWEV